MSFSRLLRHRARKHKAYVADFLSHFEPRVPARKLRFVLAKSPVFARFNLEIVLICAQNAHNLQHSKK
ncbi:hypothetical protein SBA2_280009 [Acidobacteriia bacterium SbA2]|nr:hypothetical protein SBA2_280009 [Acidobacteriia bacterium SbA2]